MNTFRKYVLPLVFGSLIINSSCSDESENNTTVSANTTNTSNTSNTSNTTIQGDTDKKDIVVDLVQTGVDIVKDEISEKRRTDNIRNANEPRIWVYQIGESYDDDDLAAKAYDKLKETHNDIYVFRKKRKEYYVFKGFGTSSKKVLEDSLSVIQTQIPARISLRDLSQLCRKLPTNTDPIKYKIKKEKKYADCKTCE